MSEFDAWTRDLDFAFVGIDKNGCVGLFHMHDASLAGHEHGLFQYVYDRGTRAFIRVACPTPPRPASEMRFHASARAGIVPLHSESFREATLIRLLPDELL